MQVPADHLEGFGHQHLVAPLAVQGDGPVVDHLTTTTTTESAPPSLPPFPRRTRRHTHLLAPPPPLSRLLRLLHLDEDVLLVGDVHHPPGEGPAHLQLQQGVVPEVGEIHGCETSRVKRKTFNCLKNSCNRLKPDPIFSAAHIRTSHVCDAALKDTEGVCGGDCQHPPGVVSVRIHAEEELQAQQGRRQTHKDEADCQQDTLDTQAETEREQLVPFPHV